MKKRYDVELRWLGEAMLIGHAYETGSEDAAELLEWRDDESGVLECFGTIRDVFEALNHHGDL